MSPAKKLKVVVVGASGETGTSIMNGLLASPAQFEVIALARPESVTKDIYQDLGQRGASVKSVDFSNIEALTHLLMGTDIVISCVSMAQKEVQDALIDASSKAGVGRFVPSFFATCCPPRGVMQARDVKEDSLDQCKRLYLPYTAIDVGWWYQFSLPRVPSGKLDAVVSFPDTVITGDGNTRTALTDLADIGKYVARIIADPRTLNKLVFAYNEVTTQDRVWRTVEAITGETIPRQYLSKGEAEEIMTSAGQAIVEDPTDMDAIVTKAMMEYRYSRGIRGDNTPEHAEYLGYLIAKDLYPDINGKSVDNFVREVVEGSRGANLYIGRDHPLNNLGEYKI